MPAGLIAGGAEELIAVGKWIRTVPLSNAGCAMSYAGCDAGCDAGWLQDTCSGMLEFIVGEHAVPVQGFKLLELRGHRIVGRTLVPHGLPLGSVLCWFRFSNNYVGQT